MGLGSKLRGKLKKAVSPIKAAARPVTSVAHFATKMPAAVRPALRTLDRTVGGAKGWAKGVALVGAAAALVPVVGTVVSGVTLTASGALAKKAASDDATREEKKATEAAARVTAAQSAAAVAAGKPRPGVLARIVAWLRGG